MKRSFVLTVFLIMIGLCGLTYAEMYQWTDKDGVMHFSNSPTDFNGVEDVVSNDETESQLVNDDMESSEDGLTKYGGSDEKKIQLEEKRMQLEEKRIELEEKQIQADKERTQLEKERIETDKEREEALAEEREEKRKKDAERREDREFRERMRHSIHY